MTTPYFDPATLNELGDTVRKAQGRPRINVNLTGSENEFKSRLADIAREVGEGTGGAVEFWIVDQGAEPEEGPRLSVEVGERIVVSYHAAPVGPEAAPFIALLQSLAAGPDKATPKLDRTTDIVVYISPDCPNCPRTAHAAAQLAAANPAVTATVIDIGLHADDVAKLGIRSVPLAIVNGGLTLVGAMSVTELAEKINEASGSGSDDRVVASLIEAGRFDAAGSALAAGNGRDAFLQIWRTSSLESRMGLMLSAEAALDGEPGALDGMVPDLLPVLETDDAARRGDTADLLGIIGHPSARDALEALLEDPVEDVAEIAAEALEGLREDTGPE